MQSVSLGGNKDSRRWYQRTARTFAKENKRGKETKQRDGMRMKKKNRENVSRKKGKKQPVRQTRWENLFISTDQYSLVWPVLSINLYRDAPESHCMPQSFICCVAHDLSRSFIFFLLSTASVIPTFSFTSDHPYYVVTFSYFIDNLFGGLS